MKQEKENSIVMEKEKTVYFLEDESGNWLKENSRTEVTNNPIEAARLNDKLEAEIFCSGLKGFKVTEHLFITR